jgi:hypothetical protein
MIAKFRHMKINQRLLIPNLLYILLFGIILFFFFNSKELINTLSHDREVTNSLMASVRNTVMKTADYLNQKITFDELAGQYKILSAQEGVDGVGAIFSRAGENLEKISSLREINNQIGNRINEQFTPLTAADLGDLSENSNGRYGV